MSLSYMYTVATEYEQMFAPAVRATRAIYSSAAGRLSERPALSLVTFLSMLEWIVYISVFMLFGMYFDVHVRQFEWIETSVHDEFEAILNSFGNAGLSAGLIAAVVVAIFLRRAIKRLEGNW